MTYLPHFDLWRPAQLGCGLSDVGLALRGVVLGRCFVDNLALGAGEFLCGVLFINVVVL